MSKDFVHRNPRPSIAIVCTGGRSLGNCYSESTFEITARRRLERKQIHALWDAGFIGYGQEFGVTSQCDGNEEPAGVDIVPCTVEIDGKPTGDAPINPYTGNMYEPYNEPYYVYRTYARVDSGD